MEPGTSVWAAPLRLARRVNIESLLHRSALVEAEHSYAWTCAMTMGQIALNSVACAVSVNHRSFWGSVT